MAKSTEDLAKLLTEFISVHKPYMAIVEERIREMANGELQFALRIYNGKVTDVVVTKTERHIIKG